MGNIAICVRNLGKCYRIGLAKNRPETLRESVLSILHAPFHYLRTRLQPPDSKELLWALHEVSFAVHKGEVLGIVGQNGAGKSTLLKILSRITEPTKGWAKIYGRVGSLLEVGTGFHPELTGRENIYLNGAILGMRRAEVARKFDEIIDFAGIEKFLDTPVKRYSSGMFVRLAFAVAAHLEPEILIVDEVLAVGDVMFRKKCLGKMESISQAGRTVLLVSHNMEIIEHLCSRAILLDKGKIAIDGDPAKVIATYLQTNTHYSYNDQTYGIDRNLLETCSHPDLRITDIQLLSSSGAPLGTFETGDPLTIRIHYEAKRQFFSPAFAVFLKNEFGQEIFRVNTEPISGYPIQHLAPQGVIDLSMDSLPLTANDYYLTVGIFHNRTEWIIQLDNVIMLRVGLKDVYGSGVPLDRLKGIIAIPHRWIHYT